jgi:hypothetical protein
MPVFHEKIQEIYDAILKSEDNEKGPILKWNSEKKLYEYSNSLYPNKKYKKIFDPKKFMARGDVIHFGDDYYRNNNKMIFDGIKLQFLYTKIDDYGSVPPEFVVGDSEDEFDIGDFEKLIEHNTINWLSKKKLEEIKLYIKNGNIEGKVTIRKKKWIILFDIHKVNEFNSGSSGFYYIKKYECLLENNNIIINIMREHSNIIDKYLIVENKLCEKENLHSFIKNDNKVNIIRYCEEESKSNIFYLFQYTKQYKFDQNQTIVNFPIIWSKKTEYFNYDRLILDQTMYDKCIANEKNLDEIYISEIFGYEIKIYSIDKNIDVLMNDLKGFINKLITDYDDVSKRYPIHYEENNKFYFYI